MQKDMNSPINAQRVIFSFKCLVLLLSLKLYTLASKEVHQSEKVERLCYAVMSTGLEIERP